MSYVGEKPLDPITFTIYPDEKGAAKTSLYEDDGNSPAYKLGVYRRTTISVSRSQTGHKITLGVAEGGYNPGRRQFVFLLAPAERVRRPVTVADDGKPRSIELR